MGSPKVKKIMELLRLRQIHNAVFVKLNACSINMLKLVLPYIAYGYPTRQMIELLIKQRGYASIRRERVPINDNVIVDNNLGKLGIRCIEDLINSLWTVDKNFTRANRFLWPFKLSSPRGGYSDIRDAISMREEHLETMRFLSMTSLKRCFNIR